MLIVNATGTRTGTSRMLREPGWFASLNDLTGEQNLSGAGGYSEAFGRS